MVLLVCKEIRIWRWIKEGHGRQEKEAWRESIVGVMEVTGTAVTAAHLAGYFVTVETRPAVNNLSAHAQPGLTKWMISANVRKVSQFVCVA